MQAQRNARHIPIVTVPNFFRYEFKEDEIESILQVWIDLSREKNWIPKAEKRKS